MLMLYIFGYSLLAHDIEAALLSVGLDPFVGFFISMRKDFFSFGYYGRIQGSSS